MTQEELIKLPKAELHCHLDGSLSKKFIEKRLGRQVDASELEKAIEGAYQKNKKHISIPGFRKGKE